MGTSKFTHIQDAVFKVDTLRDESFITSWGGGRLYSGGGVGNFFGDVLGGGVENKMTYGQGGHVFRQVLGGQMCSIGLSFH